MILTYRPFDVGDVVEAGGVTGKVAEMNLVSTTFLTFDNQKIIVPNNSIWGSVITNVTAENVRRVDLTFGVAYDAELDQVERVLHETVHNHKLVLDDPEPVIKLHELADSAVVYVCRPWVRTEDYWTVYWDLTRTVKDRFDAEGISIPFPQREIHLRHDGAATEGAGGAQGTEPAPAEPGSSA
jgi:small conductance mechanosensitive channel